MSSFKMLVNGLAFRINTGLTVGSLNLFIIFLISATYGLKTSFILIGIAIGAEVILMLLAKFGLIKLLNNELMLKIFRIITLAIMVWFGIELIIAGFSAIGGGIVESFKGLFDFMGESITNVKDKIGGFFNREPAEETKEVVKATKNIFETYEWKNIYFQAGCLLIFNQLSIKYWGEAYPVTFEDETYNKKGTTLFGVGAIIETLIFTVIMALVGHYIKGILPDAVSAVICIGIGAILVFAIIYFFWESVKNMVNNNPISKDYSIYLKSKIKNPKISNFLESNNTN